LRVVFSALERFGNVPFYRFPAATRKGDAPGSRAAGARASVRSWLRPYQLLLIVWAADVLLLAAAAALSRAAAIRPASSWNAGNGLVLATASLGWLALAGRDIAGAGDFVAFRKPWRIAAGWLHAFAVSVLVVLVAEALRDAFPQSTLIPPIGRGIADHRWLLCFFALGLGFLVSGRMMLMMLLSRIAPGDVDRRGTATLRAVVVGDGAHASRVFADLQQTQSNPLRAVGLVDDHGAAVMVPPDTGRDAEKIDFRAKAAAAKSLVDLLRRTSIDTVVIAQSADGGRQVRAILDLLAGMPLDIWLAPDFTGEDDRAPRAAAARPLLHLRGRPLSTFQLVVKKTEDMLVASLLLVLTGPLMLMIAVAIRLESPGPSLFCQQRRGYNERLFGVLKFRTMFAEARDDHAAQQTVRGDDRVTRIGRFLRRSSLDELPQLINVLRGEMSVVGPRPHALQTKADGQLFDEVVANYSARHCVKPGITGWAQVNGWRGATDTVEKIVARVEHDIDYIENWSLRRDLAIICMTVVRVFSDSDAY
jgi:Undecaprenyl-phosphate glucose phosphotransferase